MRKKRQNAEPNLYFETEDLRLARLHHELAAEIEPNFPKLYFNWGLVHAMNGDRTNAVVALNRVKEPAPGEKGSKVDELIASVENALSV